MKNELFAVGIGPGNEEMMSLQARKCLEECDVIAGYTVYADLLRPLFPDKTYLTTPMTRERERCRMAFEEAAKGKKVCVVCSGDAGVYGMASLLLETGVEWPEIRVRVIPGITAAQSGGALLGAPLGNDFAVISLSDRLTGWETIERRLRLAARADLCLALYNPASKGRPDHLKKACRILLEELPPDRLCGMAVRIGREGEESRILTLRELADAPADMFTTVFIGNSTSKDLAGHLVTGRAYRREEREETEETKGRDGDVLVFGGTTEGRELCGWLSRNGIPHTVCVATEYGASVMEQENRQGTCRSLILQGRLDAAQMQELLGGHRYRVVVDATHPYAADVTRNIRAACLSEGIPCLRLLRKADTKAEIQTAGAVWMENAKEAAAYLDAQQGNIFLTCGSKELPAFAEGIRDRERLFVRVLPSVQAIAQCEAAGLSGRHVMAMQGPFSREMNEAMLQGCHAAWMVTKETGATGGYAEKLEACRRMNATPVILRRPDEAGLDEAEVRETLLSLLRIPYASEQEGDLHEKNDDTEAPRTVLCVGIGMGTPETLTIEAVRAIRSADVLIGASRMLRSALDAMRSLALECTGVRFEEYRAETIAGILKMHPEYRSPVILVSGDVGFYSAAAAIGRVLEKEQINVRMITGITSPAYFAARLGIPWQDAVLASIHGRETGLVPLAAQNRKVMAIAGSTRDVAAICRSLEEAGMSRVRVTAGLDLSYPQEQIRTGSPADFANWDEPGLPIVLLENDGAEDTVRHALPDEAFVRGDVPMTKEEIRILSVAKLRLDRDSVVFDVGAGTGSVAVEAARICSGGKVFAIERKAEAADLIRTNAARLAAGNLTVVEGEAPDVFQKLPVPTHAFIGGSAGRMRDIVCSLKERSPGIRIVINTVTMEGLAQVTELIREGILADAQIVQVSCARAASLGGYHLMRAENPVYITAAGGAE